jgi:4-amino-4-deoxy-L-arabinose transferase-like glycosyltransferase
MNVVERDLSVHRSLGTVSSVDSRLLIIVAAAVLRIVWLVALKNDQGLSIEELEYLRIAENLSSGNGYVGLYGTGQTVHTPLLPVAVAALNLLIHNITLSGRVVSVAAGVLLPIPVYYLARRLYGRRVATIAAILVAFLPYFVWLSTHAYSEPLFLTLLATALLFAVLTLDLRQALLALLAGAFLGLAYLARPTGMYLLPATIVFMIGAGLIRRAPPVRIALHCALVSAAFLVMAAPYVAFLHKSTGHLLIDGKTAGLRAMSMAMYQGAGYPEAALGITGDLQQTGFELDQTAFTVGLLQGHREGVDLDNWLRETVLHAPQNSRPIARSLLLMTSPLVAMLCLVGIARLVEPTPERLGRLFVFVAFGILLAIQIALPWFMKRFAGPLLLFVLLYAAVGLDWLTTIIRRSVTSRLPRRTKFSRYLIPGFATALLLVSTAPSLASLADAGHVSCYASAKSAGLWLSGQGVDGLRVMDRSMEVTYYSGGTALMPPYTDAETALRYIATHRPTHIVVFQPTCRQTPYLCNWLEDGIPDPRATLVLETTSPDGCRLKIYEWK